jgi:acyl-coenzyme A synthetase/AMP-(fatty) acid ligase
MHAAAIAFTSGSTGGPQPHVKSWRTLALTAAMCAERFLGAPHARHHVVATVPPQHMYGLELSVMMALAGGCATHEARPFFPDDVRAVLASVPEPRVLVTTPVHLKALAAARLAYPPVAKVISATAPLAPALAEEAEAALGAPVHEIYGCTEAGSMCTRRTLDGERWLPYPGLRLHHHDGMTHVTGAHLDQPVATPDVVETHDDGTITLLGRVADMIKVAGKRASLVQLTGALLAIDGVEDGVVFLPGDEGDHPRTAALVVAPRLSEQDVLRALAERVDPVFLPRPLRRVQRLPRNALGKLPRAELLALLEAKDGAAPRPAGGADA